MDGKRFDSLAMTIGRRRSRRGAFQALASVALGATAVRIGLSAEPAEADEVTAERRFACTAVGDACKGNDSQCCSGRCKGKKSSRSKDGSRRRNRGDKSRCVAHDQAECTSGDDTCDTGLAVPCGFRGRGGCLKTTGKASFCGQIEGQSPPRLRCENCTTDQDCEALGYGSGAACVVCFSECEFRNNNATACVGPED
jgi:hypothetical protein